MKRISLLDAIFIFFYRDICFSKGLIFKENSYILNVRKSYMWRVEMSTVEITSSSTKGQIVIPSSIRKQLGIKAGTKFIAMTDGANLLLKPIKAPKINSFSKLIKESQNFARKKGITEDDIKDAIKAVRSEKNHS